MTPCRLAMMLAVAAFASPLWARPALAWCAGAPRWACRHHGRPHGRIVFPPPYAPFPNGFSEPYGAPPSGPDVFAPSPPGGPSAAPGYAAPSASRTALPGGMLITVRKILRRGDDGGAKTSPLIERPVQAAARLAACWSPPLPQKGETVEATIRFSFNSRGTVIGGAPRVTYVKPGAGQSAEDVRNSILSAVRDCAPLRFSASMAASAPGYPLSIRFIGQRPDENERQK
ncbi:hypothetical protein [Rhodoblastus sp.]|uniref:hypothetical protein n=1 Tax=Rhodoblastus sp. TaxID=1962975 RepID=UPI003F99B365